MIQLPHDSLSSISHPIISAGTAAVIMSPDHTTQILSLIVQVIAIVAMFFGKKKA